MNYYKHYIGDFQRDTTHLSLTERGAYLALIHHYYATEQPLPNTHALLCRIAGAITPVEQRAVKAVMSFFKATESGFVHNRIEAELEKAGQRADTNREIAVAREAKRKATRDAKKTGLDEHEQSTNRARIVTRTEHEQSTNDQPIPVTNNQEAKAKPTPLASVPSADDVKADLWRRWKALPEGGGGAYLAKLIREHGPEQRVLEAVERTLDHDAAEPKSFIVGLLKREAKQDTAYDDLLARVI